MPLKTGIHLDPKDARRYKELMQHLGTIGVSIDKVMDSTMKDTVGRVKKEVIKMDAVETYNLHDNVKSVKHGMNNYALESEAIDPETNRDYAPVVHEGLGDGANSKPRPYLQVGLRYFKYKFERNIRQLFRSYTSLGDSFKSRFR